MASVRPIFNRQSGKNDPDRKPVGYEVRYRDGSGRERTKGGFGAGATLTPTSSRWSRAASRAP